MTSIEAKSIIITAAHLYYEKDWSCGRIAKELKIDKDSIYFWIQHSPLWSEYHEIFKIKARRKRNGWPL